MFLTTYSPSSLGLAVERRAESLTTQTIQASSGDTEKALELTVVVVT